jgi:hypothetical protein
VLEDPLVPRLVEAFNLGTVGTAVVEEDLPGTLQNYQVFWFLAGRPVQESVFPFQLEVWIFGDPDN